MQKNNKNAESDLPDEFIKVCTTVNQKKTLDF